MSENRTIRPQLALEMTMRDVLGNMEEMVSDYGLRNLGGEFEILAIERLPGPASVVTAYSDPYHISLFSAEIRPLQPTRKLQPGAKTDAISGFRRVS